MAVEIKIPATLEFREQGSELKLMIKCRVAEVNRTLYVKLSNVTNLAELLSGVKSLFDITAHKISEEIQDQLDNEAVIAKVKEDRAAFEQKVNEKKIRPQGL